MEVSSLAIGATGSSRSTTGGGCRGGGDDDAVDTTVADGRVGG